METYQSSAARIKNSCLSYPVIVIFGSQKACKLLDIQKILPAYHFVDLTHDISTRNQVSDDPQTFLNTYSEFDLIINGYHLVPELHARVVARAGEYKQLITSIATNEKSFLNKSALHALKTINNSVVLHTLVENPTEELCINETRSKRLVHINEKDFNSVVIVPSFNSLIAELQKERYDKIQ